MNLSDDEKELIRDAIITRLGIIKKDIYWDDRKVKPPLTSDQMELILKYEKLLERL